MGNRRDRILNLDFGVVPLWECQLSFEACLGTSFLINSAIYLFLPTGFLLDRKSFLLRRGTFLKTYKDERSGTVGHDRELMEEKAILNLLPLVMLV